MLPRDIAGEVWRDPCPDPEKGENLPGYTEVPGCRRGSTVACPANATRPLHDDRRPTKNAPAPAWLACMVGFRGCPRNGRRLAEMLLVPTLVPPPPHRSRTV